MSIKKSYSQFGEDIEVLNFFQNKNSGYYVEIGANDGLRGSNTVLLEQNGWKGLLIEANPDLISIAAQLRPNSTIINCAVLASKNIGTIDFYQVKGSPPHLDGLSTIMDTENFIPRIISYGGEIKKIRVPATTLNDLLVHYKAPSSFEFLSIDVEGAELEVLKGFSIDRFTPRIILIEDNSYGADISIRNYLQQYGYIRVHRTGVNDWYVQSKDTSFFIKQRIVLFLRLTKWSIQRRIQSRNTK